MNPARFESAESSATPEVFISYSGDDQAIADAVCVHLERAGFRCWIASRDGVPGEFWAQSIVSAIRSCRVFVLVFSSSANRSVTVLKEVDRANHYHRVVVPLRIEPVVPSGALELLLGAVQWLTAAPPTEQHFLALVDHVGRHLRGVRTFEHGAARFELVPLPELDLYVCKSSVTQRQWEAVMDSRPSHFGGANCPVESVSWTDTSRFIERLNEREDGFRYRLLTVDEWERAARAGARAGDPVPPTAEIAWFWENSGGTTKPVGLLRPNPWGLCDMWGNVWEWCSGATSQEGLRPAQGGCWGSSAKTIRASPRCEIPISSRSSCVGFRFAGEAQAHPHQPPASVSRQLVNETSIRV